MPSEAFEKVVEAARKLNGAEQWQLRDLLDVWLAPPGPPPSEEELAQEMLREGILDHVPPPLGPDELAAYRKRKPVETLHGIPVSQTIIEERR